MFATGRLPIRRCCKVPASLEEGTGGSPTLPSTGQMTVAFSNGWPFMATLWKRLPAPGSHGSFFAPMGPCGHNVVAWVLSVRGRGSVAGSFLFGVGSRLPRSSLVNTKELCCVHGGLMPPYRGSCKNEKPLPTGHAWKRWCVP